jgi:small-conductance mechanosensitive channel
MTTFAHRRPTPPTPPPAARPSRAAPATKAPPKQTPPDLDRLDALLSGLIDEHRQLLGLTRDHKAALTTADAQALKAVVEQTGAVIQRVNTIETERQQLVARPDGRPSTMDELLAAVNTADRQRLTQRAGTLRDLIRTVQQEQEAVRLASEALATHMRGLMQQVASKLSHAGTYGRAGRVEPVATVMTGLDIPA